MHLADCVKLCMNSKFKRRNSSISLYMKNRMDSGHIRGHSEVSSTSIHRLGKLLQYCTRNVNYYLGCKQCSWINQIQTVKKSPRKCCLN